MRCPASPDTTARPISALRWRSWSPDLRHAHRVLAVQLGDDRTDDGALLLQRPYVAEEQVEGQRPYVHVVPGHPPVRDRRPCRRWQGHQNGTAFTDVARRADRRERSPAPTGPGTIPPASRASAARGFSRISYVAMTSSILMSL